MKVIKTVEEWLGKDNQLGIDIWKNKYRYNNETFEEWLDRVSGKDEELKQLIIDKKFLFGGRTLSNRGTNIKGSFSNCYSSGFVQDSLDDIMKTNTELALTYKAQGGQGVSLTKLRPKGCKVGNGEYESDGIVPFMELFNQTTESVSQGGSRKGALIMTIDVWHKQAMDFITIKSDINKINKANLSLEIDNEFMNIVVSDIENGTETVIERTEVYGKFPITYKVIPVKIFKKLAELSWDNGEPAPIYVDLFRNYNLMQYCDDYKIEICNPCGEQPLPKYGACNLGSINLSEFVINPYTTDSKFDYGSFINAVQITVKALDDVLEENLNNHALKEQSEMARNYRNIGLGIMGLGSMLFKLGIKYGSKQSKEIIEQIITTMFRTSVKQSSKLAIEKGSFLKYSNKVWESDIIKNAFLKTEIEELKNNGLRNCSLLSIAPSGSIGTLLNITTGCEPAFAIKYQRKTESLHGGEEKYYDVYIQEAKEYMKLNDTTELPDYFIASENINWKDRVEIQGILQKYVDTSISSTVNLPNSATINDVVNLYIYAWKMGCKGITVFRQGCARVGILTTENKEDKIESKEIITNSNSNLSQLEWGTTISVDDDVVGLKRKLQTGCGSLHCTSFFDPISGRLLETYFSKGSSGGCNNFMTSLSRMVSLAARSGVSIESIVDQLHSCGVCPSYSVRNATKKDTSKGSSCPVAIGYALLDMYKEAKELLGLDEDEIEEEIKQVKSNDKITNKEADSQAIVNNQFEVCPKCKEKTLASEGGCVTCHACSYTKCD